MDKQLLKFMNKEATYVETLCGIGVDRLNPNSEYVMIKICQLQTDKPTYGFWNNPQIPVASPNEKEETKKKKHTGGKLSYTKIFISELEKYPRDKLSHEHIGMCVRLAPTIEWDTGVLKIGRGKKKHNMSQADISKELGVSESTVKRFTKKMVDLELMKHDKLGYKMTGNLFAKGRSIPCELSLKKE